MMKRIPIAITEEATVTSSEVPMLQAASAAGLTADVLASASTTALPAKAAGEQRQRARDQQAEADGAKRLIFVGIAFILNGIGMTALGFGMHGLAREAEKSGSANPLAGQTG